MIAWSLVPRQPEKRPIYSIQNGKPYVHNHTGYWQWMNLSLILDNCSPAVLQDNLPVVEVKDAQEQWMMVDLQERVRFERLSWDFIRRGRKGDALIWWSGSPRRVAVAVHGGYYPNGMSRVITVTQHLHQSIAERVFRDTYQSIFSLTMPPVLNINGTDYYPPSTTLTRVDFGNWRSETLMMQNQYGDDYHVYYDLLAWADWPHLRMFFTSDPNFYFPMLVLLSDNFVLGTNYRTLKELPFNYSGISLA